MSEADSTPLPPETAGPARDPSDAGTGDPAVAPSQAVRLRLIVAFDGSRYQGWQTQRIGTGVQELVEHALRQLFPGTGPLHGSSRTDTGVHALGMVAHVDVPAVECRIPDAKLVLALNAHLPEDIRVLSAGRTDPSFHARFQAVSKEYRYQVWNAPAMNPLLRHVAWHVTRPLDLDRMRAAAARLPGRRDFAAFTTNPGYARASTVRTLHRCDIIRRGPRLTFILEGDGFLYRMCRGIVGTLVQVGLGRFRPEDLAIMLEARDRRLAGMTAPAHGLMLHSVRYPGTRPQGEPSLHVVLVEPEIPPNTGNIARLCAAIGAHLHLIEPMGFRLDDATLRRAGMDYWRLVSWSRWRDWATFRRGLPGKARLWFVEDGGPIRHDHADFQQGDYLVFGRETAGLPAPLLEANAHRWIRIPMLHPGVRSLNLSSSVAIVAYEALRQAGFENLAAPSSPAAEADR